MSYWEIFSKVAKNISIFGGSGQAVVFFCIYCDKYSHGVWIFCCVTIGGDDDGDDDDDDCDVEVDDDDNAGKANSDETGSKNDGNRGNDGSRGNDGNDGNMGNDGSKDNGNSAGNGNNCKDDTSRGEEGDDEEICEEETGEEEGDDEKICEEEGDDDMLTIGWCIDKSVWHSDTGCIRIVGIVDIGGKYSFLISKDENNSPL